MQRRTMLSLMGALLWPVRVSAEQEPGATPKENGRSDGAVLETVCKALLSDPESPLEPRQAEQKQILLSTEALTRRPSLETVLLRHDAKQWAKLSPGQSDLVQVAAKEIVRRTTAREQFQGLDLKDPRIVPYTRADDEKAAQDKDPLRRFRRPQVFRAYPPGYSPDGKLAVVHVTFPWSGGFHSGNATFVLLREGEAWSVLMRQFILYV